MNRELIIEVSPLEVTIALLEEKVLVELNKEKSNNDFSVGDIYLGRVKKIMPGLNAAFVDVGYEKDAFLHYFDLGAQINSLNKFISKQGNNNQLPDINIFNLLPDIDKSGKISSVIKLNQQLLIQVAKEPISTKGPRVSSEISFAGRYLVLVPFSNKISVSQKIKDPNERNRLKRLITSIRPNNFGVIIRTVAENKKVAELDSDLKGLISKWDTTINRLTKAKAPQKVLSEIDRTSAILRDILNESFNNIHINDISVYEEIKLYISKIAPNKTDIVKHYKGKAPIFEYFGVDKQIRNSFGKVITIRSGVYLIVEHTEALHVIDVNSGHRVNSDNSQETNALEVNIEAAIEIARQLRLRDMGGIIVIDFIDMHESANRKKLYQKIKDEMSKDHAKHTILPPSKFGLVQITRQRVRPTMKVEVFEKCPSCGGAGQVKSSIAIIDQIENNITYLINEQNEQFIKIAVHPFIYAYLTKGIYSIKIKWLLKYKKNIKIISSTNYQFLEYKFFNKNDEEIKM